jgi:hypothetical protein
MAAVCRCGDPRHKHALVVPGRAGYDGSCLADDCACLAYVPDSSYIDTLPTRPQGSPGILSRVLHPVGTR